MQKIWRGARERIRRAKYSALALGMAVAGYFLIGVCLEAWSEAVARFGPGPDFGVVLSLILVGYYLFCSAFMLVCFGGIGVWGMLYAAFGSTRR